MNQKENQDQQLPAAPPLLFQGTMETSSVAGCWSAGERILAIRGRCQTISVWFHFFGGGESLLSLRRQDQPETARVHGQWWIEGNLLVAAFSGGIIRAPFCLKEELLLWAGETLVRLPDTTASLPFGIRLPYRLSLPDQEGVPGAVCPDQA